MNADIITTMQGNGIGWLPITLFIFALWLLTIVLLSFRIEEVKKYKKILGIK